MQNLIIDNILLTIFLPLWIFLIIMGGRFVSIYVKKVIVYILTLFSSAFGGIICISGLFNIKDVMEWCYPFIKINDFVINIGIRADKISLIMAAVLFCISFCVQLYSISYVKDDKKNYRFFALLNLFNFAMSALLFSPNLFQLYVFWEIVGIVSYLLIGFNYADKIKSEASKRVFLINRFGDTALISAIIITSNVIFNYGGNMSFVTLSTDDFNAISTLLYAYTSTPVFWFICGMFIIAAIVKSAQFPFHIWLQDAMEAKLPVSALLHSATMVATGVYLIIRLMPFFILDNRLMQMIIFIGILTAIICAVFASIEIHPKKVLAYSTSANLGLMFMALGMENIKAALIFFTAHAFIKSILFLSLPSENNSISRFRFIVFIYGAISLAGLLFTGFCAKEALYCTLEPSSLVNNLFLAVGFLGAFYITRLVIIIKNNTEFTASESKIENFGILLLLILSIILYGFIHDIQSKSGSLYIISLLGILTPIILFKFDLLTKINKVPCFTEIFINKFIPFMYDKFTQFLNYIDINVLSNYKPILCTAKIGVNIINFIEENIMNKSVNTIKDICLNMSKGDKIIQSGNVQTYNSYAFIFVTIIITFIILSLFMLGQSGAGGI